MGKRRKAKTTQAVQQTVQAQEESKGQAAADSQMTSSGKSPSQQAQQTQGTSSRNADNGSQSQQDALKGKQPASNPSNTASRSTKNPETEEQKQQTSQAGCGRGKQEKNEFGQICTNPNCQHASNGETDVGIIDDEADHNDVYDENADVVFTQPNFNIREGGVNHNSSTTTTTKASQQSQHANQFNQQKVKQKQGGMPAHQNCNMGGRCTNPEHQAMMNQNNPYYGPQQAFNATDQKRYSHVDPQSNQPVVTMQDVILQDEQQRQEQDEQKRNCQVHGDDQCDDEECDEDLDEETDEEEYTDGEDEQELSEGLYTFEDDQTDSNAHWHDVNNQANTQGAHPGYQNHKQARNQNHAEYNNRAQGQNNAQGAQYAQQQQQQKHQQQYQNAAQQRNQGAAHNQHAQQQQHYNQQQQQYYQQQQQQQQHQPHPQQQSMNQTDAQSKLTTCLTDMLIFLYNGKPTNEFRENYATVAQILSQKRRTSVKPENEINADFILQIFNHRIENIVGTVRDKLQDDATRDTLVYEVEEPVTEPQDESQKQVRLVAKSYRDHQAKFDEILSAVGDYFELFKNNTNKLEDLWLLLLDYLKLKNMKKTQVFKEMHYSIYIRTVIKNPNIQQIILEAQKWSDHQGVSEHLVSYLEKIKEIEKESQFLPEKYEDFKRMTYLDQDLNAFTKQWIQEQLKQQQARRLKQQKAAQQHDHYEENVECHDNQGFSDCQEFENHRQKVKGYCCCKCEAKQCLYDHLGISDNPHQRRHHKDCQRNRQKGAGGSCSDNRTQGHGSSCEQENQGNDEQVYKMNLEDLCAYITQPDVKKTKKKAKKKKRKETTTAGDGEENSAEDDSKQTQDYTEACAAQHQNNSANAKSSNFKTTDQESPKGSANAGRQAQHGVSNGAAKDSGGGQAASGTIRSASTAPEKSSSMFASASDVGNVSSAASSIADSAAAAEEIAQNFSDEQFETAMANFSKRLEAYCNERVAKHAQRMKPNYDGQWIVNLKLKLKKFDASTDGKDAPSSAAASSKKGRGKH